MEREFFNWDGYDQPGDWALQFYDVEFIKEIGPFKIGDKFDCVVIDFERGVMESYDREGKVLNTVEVGLRVK